MRLFKRLAVVLSLFACVLAVRAGTPYTFAGLGWDFSTSLSGYTQCDTLDLDVTGDPNSRNASYTAYGTLWCPGFQGYYAVDGVAYFVGTSSFNMTLDIGPFGKLVCYNLNTTTYGGSCTMYSSGASASAFIEIL